MPHLICIQIWALLMFFLTDGTLFSRSDMLFRRSTFAHTHSLSLARWQCAVVSVCLFSASFYSGICVYSIKPTCYLRSWATHWVYVVIWRTYYYYCYQIKQRQRREKKRGDDDNDDGQRETREINRGKTSNCKYITWTKSHILLCSACFKYRTGEYKRYKFSFDMR